MRLSKSISGAGRKLLVAVLAALVVRQGIAVPANPDGITVKQPNGKAIRVFLRGDEYLHWNADSLGFTILKSEPAGPWVYAVRDAAGSLSPSTEVVGEADPVKLGIPKQLLALGAETRVTAALDKRSVEEEGLPLKVPLVGTMKNLVLLVAFSDKAFSYTRAEIDALFNTIGYTSDGAQGSVKDYYHEVSYNQLTVDSVVVEPVTLANGYAYYGGNDANGDDLRPREMVQEGLAALEARGFDFSTLDSDGDGEVDGLTVIHAGGGEENGGNDANYIWSHQWSMISTVTYDGKSMRPYHTEPERRGWDSIPSSWGVTRIGVICHENGHFLGLPDLYDYGYDSEGAGEFCLMAGGSWNGDSGTQPAQLSAWCKKDLGWITPVVVTGGGTYDVPRVEDNKTVYQLSGAFPASQYFLIENRQGYGFDASLPGSTRGLLVWHVDENQANNDDQTHYKVDLEEASGTQHLELNSNSGDDADYFRSGTMTAFDSGTTPNSLSYAGIPLGIDVTAVSASAATMTFTVGALPVARFEWDPISSPQSAGNPIPVRIVAKDAFGGTASAFTGAVNLSGYTGGPTVLIGSGTTSWIYPMPTYYHDSRTQVIYLAAELGGASTYAALALDVATVPGQVLNAWTIRMKHTALSSYSPAPSWESTGWTVVYQANQAVSDTGWITFRFTTPFAYNGSDNLLVDFSHNNASYTTDGECACTPDPANRSIYYRSDSDDGDPLAWSGKSSPKPLQSQNVPNIRLSGPESSVPISPVTSGGFTAGVWSGNMTVSGAATDMRLRADDGSGHTGDSDQFTVIATDITPPTVTINQAAGQSDPINSSPINFTVVFSEPVSDFATGDVTIAGTAPGTKAGAVTGSGATYNVAVSGMAGSGTVVASIAAGVASDAAGNTSTASTSTDNTVTYDVTVPSISSITSTNANGTYGEEGEVNVTINFSEGVTLGGGNLVITLETGDADRDVVISSISGADSASGVYTVQVGDVSADLSVKSVALSGSTLRDAAGNDADLSIPPGQNLDDNKDIVVEVTTYGLTVSSAYGMTAPPTGVHVYASGTVIICSVTNSTAMVYTATRSAQVVCTGWVGTGSAPASGMTTNTGSFPLNSDSSVTWLWTVSNLWLSNLTVTTTISEVALDSITAGDGYVVDPAGDVTLEGGREVRLQSGFTASSGSVFRATIGP